MEQSFFEQLLDYLNSFSDGTEISRKELINHFTSSGVLRVWTDGKPYTTVLDVYRNYITQAGFLKIKSRGVYIKVKHCDLTYKQIKIKAYGK